MYHLILETCSDHHIAVFSRQFSSANRVLPLLRSSPKIKQKGVEKALQLLDLITPKSSNSGSSTGGGSSHARLIQSCMEDLLQTSTKKYSKKSNKALLQIIGEQIQVTHDGTLLKDNPFSLFQEIHRRGFSSDPALVSGVLSSCGSVGDLGTAVQLQSFSVKTCLNETSPVASSLISLYSKCGKLSTACQVFEEMHSRNTVLYTSIVAAYAQHRRVELCLHLFVDMKRSGFEPNDFTFSSILSACTDTGYLGLGRSIHSLEIQMGFDLYQHVSNALISMYAKCGSIHEAAGVFEKMALKDLISWNSMISGYAHYGLADEALNLLEKMGTEKILPDAISFLGVLSSCRHAGLVEQGRQCFNSMLEHGIVPDLDHYSCIVDLLGRAGLLDDALSFIQKMPMAPNAIIWGSLLSSCKVYGNSQMGISAAHSRLLLEPGCAATHVQLANMYAAMGCWNDVAKIRKLMKERGLKTSPGYSWIEVGNEIHRFKAEGRSNSEVNETITVLDSLDGHMKSSGYLPEINFDLLDEDFCH